MKAIGIAALVLGAFIAIPAAPSTAAGLASPSPGPLHFGPRDTTGTVWGGYATETSLTAPQNGAVTDVRGSWTVPTVACGSGNTYSASWIGIDGYADKTVEQTGTEQDCIGGSAQYYAWYEFFPKQGKTIPLSIHPGDTMTSEVQYQGGGKFLLTLTDANDGANGTFSITLKMENAQLQSGEWVVEPPAQGNVKIQGLANFGTETFTGCSVTINGVTGPIDSGQDDPMTLVDANGNVLATPSGLRDTNGTSSFTFTYSG